jgi:CDGSH-type Zn-finger protein
MSEPVMAAQEPVKVRLEAGKKYAWCACGLGGKQPFCDGSHKTTDIHPIVFEVKETQEAWLCQCKKTGRPPYCDGTHKNIPS